MVNLLNPLLMGPAQGLQQPPAMPAAVSAPSRFAALGERAKSLLAPEVAWPMAAGMFMGRTPSESLGNAFMFGGQAMGEQKVKEEGQRQQNATLAYLQKSRPDLAAAVSAGMPMQMAWQHAFNKGGDFTDDMREYQMAADQGFGGSFMDYMTTMKKAGATNVNIPGQPTIGTVPQGWAATQDPQSGEWSMAPIKGGPEAQKAEQAVAAGESKDEQRRTWNLIVNEEIGRALKIAKDGGWLPTTGLGSDLAAGVGGTAARDLRGLLDTVRANAGFDRLQAMRDASPTGGALGQVSERELAFLQSTIGNLEQSQSKEQLVYNLERLQKIYQNMLEGRRAYDGLLADNGASGGWQDRGGGVKIRRLD